MVKIFKYDLIVFIPVYNQEDVIMRAIASILCQETEYKFKIYALDDCSYDKSYEILKQIQQEHPKVIEIIRREKNLGPFKNLHLELCKKIDSEFWTVLDGDDYWIGKNKIEYSLNILKKYKHCSCFAHQTLLGWNRKNFYNSKESVLAIKRNYNKIQLRVGHNIILPHTSSRIYRNIICFENIPEQFVFDVSLFILFLNLGDCYYFPRIMSIYDTQRKASYWRRAVFSLNDEQRIKLLEKQAIILFELSKFLNWKFDSSISLYISKKVVYKNFEEEWMKYFRKIINECSTYTYTKGNFIFIYSDNVLRYYILSWLIKISFYNKYKVIVNERKNAPSFLNYRENDEGRINTKRGWRTMLLNRCADVMNVKKIFFHINNEIKSKKDVLAIYGAGGLGIEVLKLANKIREFEIVFVDDLKFNRYVNGINVLSFEDAINKYSKAKLKFVIAVGEPKLRKNLFDKVVCAGYSFATLVHPIVDIPIGVCLGQGVVICEQSVFTCDSIIVEENVYIQSNVVIGHDIKISEHSVLSPFVCIGGFSVIGKCVYIGMFSAVKEKVKIGAYSIISMGSMVFSDVPESVVVFGNPARLLLKNENEKVFK
ncbi:MAG: NeuD/PglB/VioB family sugar acetyltransferase [Endomicrobium sp.]|jgi:sugar O-acyltransferase (sialic acid O-acetyltransferase NeuD family)|nr:NeuD/PglB/VioB family sugar acetyltransferase [Endomicrobium sp.]